jgi:hypothetical protein
VVSRALNKVRPVLHIVASCADSKSETPLVRLRDVRGPSLDLRYDAWRRALQSQSLRLPAEELYKGAYWSIVRSLPLIAHTAGWNASLWISSAGYGLVASDAKVAAYSATFARGHADSVVRPSDPASADAAWWRLATAGKQALSRSVESLAAGAPTATILVVASPTYLSAMARDIENASRLVRGRGAILVVSSKLPAALASLQPYWLQSNACLQEALGGSLVSLHARTSRHLLSVIEPKLFTRKNVSTMREKLEQVSGEKKPRVSGAATTDDDVLAFIRKRVAELPKTSHTGLLREFRESGRACEQSRFRRLFAQAVGAR